MKNIEIETEKQRQDMFPGREVLSIQNTTSTLPTTK